MGTKECNVAVILASMEHEATVALPSWSQFHKTDPLADCTDFNTG